MASKREVVNIPGLAHGAPIPNGAKIGNMVFSSAISGRDTETGKL
ncbi:MAG: RidA family protein, partial [Deltaproteobacteria bacterium]|nr:RidA family protein [Deltaproteobacteria bacterium]